MIMELYSKASFLSIPLEIRLHIFFFVAQSDPKPLKQSPFTILDTGASEPILCRPAPKNLPKYNPWAWPGTFASQSLYCTNRQLNHEMREAFHPGPLQLKIMDDIFFSLSSSERLVEFVEKRPWLLSQNEGIRVVFTAWNVYPDLWPRLHPWLPAKEMRGRIRDLYVSPVRIIEVEALGTLPFKRRIQVRDKQYSLRNLASLISKFQKLEKVELSFESHDAFTAWTDPWGDLAALQKGGVGLVILLDRFEYVRNFDLFVQRIGGKTIAKEHCKDLWEDERVYDYRRVDLSNTDLRIESEDGQLVIPVRFGARETRASA
jgi:hypothetical protein